MSNNDEYALNWSNHTSHIRKAFQTLLQRDEFVDVTLSCEGKKIKAHRMVLSACSSYFHDLLQDNPCPHPIIILRDFKYDNIKNIIMFMYNGEVQVPTENFGSFLKTAEMLEVCGLTGDSQAKDVTSAPPPAVEEEKVSEVVTKEWVKPGPASKKLERERRKIAESRKRSNDEEALQHKKKKERQDLKSEKTEGNETDEELNLLEAMASSESSKGTQKQSVLQGLLGGDELYLSKETNPDCECPICAQKFSNMNLLRQHIPFHLGETKCQYCGSTFARRDLLKKHQLNVHKINPNSFK